MMKSMVFCRGKCCIAAGVCRRKSFGCNACAVSILGVLGRREASEGADAIYESWPTGPELSWEILGEAVLAFVQESIMTDPSNREAAQDVNWLQSLKDRLAALQDVQARMKYLRSIFGQTGVQIPSPNSSQGTNVDNQTAGFGQTGVQIPSPNSSPGENVDNLTARFSHLRATWDLQLGDADRESIVEKLKELLGPVVRDKTQKEPRMMTVMHFAAFLGLRALMEMLAKRYEFLEAINATDSDLQTPLHLAALTGSLEAVKFLDAQEILRANMEDSADQTAFEIADEVGWHEIVKVLLNRTDVKDYLSKRRAERSMYGDGTNAILVGAALIASITFAGWLQPPLGYQKYYRYPRNATMPGAPPDDFQQFAAIAEHLSVKVFWIANSLSFYFAIAAILTGAGAMVPRRGLGELAEVKRKRGAVYLTGFVFSWAVVFVVIAFAAAGFASLPPGFAYASYMTFTLVVGCYVSVHSFISVRMSDPSLFLRYLEYVDPAWYFSKMSGLLEQCYRFCGYSSYEERKRHRERAYNPPPV